MKLPKELYEVYEQALSQLNEVEASDLSICYITVNKYGEVQEHDDEVFDDGPFWFSYGLTETVDELDTPEGGFPDAVWHLLKRRVEP